MTSDEFAPFGAAIVFFLGATFCLLIKGPMREYYSYKAKECKNQFLLELWQHNERTIVPRSRIIAILLYIASFWAIVYGIVKILHYNGLNFLSNTFN